jgi:DNA-binding LytR/AlgR family response regulator
MLIKDPMDINDKIPEFLNTKRNILRLIIFTAAFALVFINVYSPFEVYQYLHLTRGELLFYSSLVILTGILVVVISRIIMYYYSRKRDINYVKYFFWVIAEIFFMSLFYAFYIKYILHDQRYFPDLFIVTIQNTALVLLLPYSVLWLYFSWEDKKSKLNELAIGQGASSTDQSKTMVPFHDEKGILRFSVKIENLLYLEAADNYIYIFYLNKSKVDRFVLRNTLKNIEEELKSTEIVRCHRSYMVNFDKVKVIRKQKDGVYLELDFPSVVDLPVSKTYIERVMNTFANFSATLKE